MRSPALIVPGFEASVGRLVEKWKYFSLPFNSLMSRVSGSIVLSLVAVGLSKSVAVKVREPILIFIFVVVAWLLSPFPSAVLPERGGAALVHDMELAVIPNVRSAMNSR